MGSSSAEERWARLVDDEVVGEPIDAGDLEFLQTYERGEPGCGTERQMWNAIGAVGTGAPTHRDRALARAALERYRSMPRQRWVPRAVRFAATSIAAAAGGLVVWFVVQRPTATAPREPAELHVTSGLAIDESGAVASSGSVLTANQWLTASGRVCLSGPEASACLEMDSRFRAGAGDLELDRGQAEIAGNVGVLVPGARLSTRSGEFRVERKTDHVVVVVVVAPVTIETAGRDTATLASGAAVIYGDGTVESVGEVSTAPKPSRVRVDDEPEPTRDASAPVLGNERRGEAPSLSANALAERARKAIAADDIRAAIRAYNRLIAAHPGSREARTGAVALGRLQLRAGRAKAALRAFEHYLREDGPLGEEAAWGRIQALGQLSRGEERERAISEFRTKYPRSAYHRRFDAPQP